VGGGEEVAAPIDLTNVRCLRVLITGVHLLPVPPDNGDPDPNSDADGGWVRLDVEPVEVDLINLPTDPLVIAFDPDVPAGEYHRLRFITGEENWIYFATGFEVGRAQYHDNPDLGPDEDSCVDPDPVRVPSGPQTGLKTDIALTVPDLVDNEVREVELFFDESTTIRNAVATGSGTVNLTPVLLSRP
jgi:hypothetical protein